MHKPKFKTDSKIVQELLRLDRLNGGILLPSQVVDSAKDETSPLHEYFDWNDTEAAAKWRTHQARNILRVCVWYDETKQNKDPVKVFVSLKSDRRENEGYRVITDVLSNKGRREQLLMDAMEELMTFRKKYSSFIELAGVFSEIGKLIQSTKLTTKAK